MNIISLFGGIETGYLTFKDLGITNYYSSEIDKYAKAIAKYNFPNIIDLGDITLINEETLSKMPKIDWIIFGSPCQSFSLAGKQEGFSGESGLFYEAVKIVEYINHYNNSEVNILMENVVMKKEWQNTITRELKLATNREIYCTPLNSALVSAQNRPRLYWTNFFVEQPKDKYIDIKKILEKNVDKKYFLSKEGVLGNLKSTFRDRQPKDILGKCGCLKIGGNKANIVMDYDYWKSLTLSSSIDYDKLGARNLTPIECERLQTLPDNYTKFGNFDGVVKEISDTQRYKCIGNGWTHEIIKHIVSQKKTNKI